MEGKVRYIWWGVLGLFIIGAALRFLLPAHSPVEFEQAQENSEIIVYITGAVKIPGLLSLPIDARLDDALQAAEVTAEADFSVLNPAQKLRDGQKIIIPYKPTEQDISSESTTTGASVPVVGQESTYASASERININTAGTAELEGIPGIGPVLARRIIDYRMQNGLFAVPEDIMNVSGIGSKTYEKMALSITVGP